MSDHPRPIRIVDVFTETALAGNQLAVVLDGRDLSTESMQRIAREMNFSETTFVLPPDDPSHAARVRIFAPTVEMKFAGHPTIGTAWVIATEGLVPGGALEFTLDLKVGPVKVRGERKDGRLMFWLSNPPLTFGEVMSHALVAGAIGLEEMDLVRDIPAQVVSTGNPLLFVALRSRDAVDRAVSDATRLERLLNGRNVFGVYLFASHGRGLFYSRMFSLDIPEDPASGSAGGPLGAYAVRYGLVERTPRVSIVSEQGTKMGRQSFLHIELAYERDAELPSRIEVGGSVVPVLRGELF